MKYARSHLMEMAGRSALLMTSRMPLAYGRRLLCAMALEELARRAVLRYNAPDCGLLRAQRLERVVSGRALQANGRLLAASPKESALQYAPIINSLLQMHNMTQAAIALASMNQVLKKVGYEN